MAFAVEYLLQFVFPKHFSGQYLIQNKRRMKKWNTPLNYYSWARTFFCFFHFPPKPVTLSSARCSSLWTARGRRSSRREPTQDLGNCSHDLPLAVRRTCKPPKVQRIVDINIGRSSVCAVLMCRTLRFKYQPINHL